MDRHSGIMLTAALLAVLGGPLAGAGEEAGNTVDGSPLATALARLAATEEALDRTRLKYLEAVGQQDIDAKEAEDFKGFIVALDRQLGAVCDEVRTLGGDLSAHAAYCARGGERGDASLPGAASTEAEIAARIDHEFDAVISEFDEMLLREQQALDRQARQASSSSAGAGGGAGNGSSDGSSGGGAGGGAGGGEGQAGATGNSGQAQVAEQSQSQGSGAGAAAAGGGRAISGPPGRGGRGKAAGIGADIPDGRDDDVVARQLREAAMKEQDPELSRRLWEEYKRYKQGKGAN